MKRELAYVLERACGQVAQFGERGAIGVAEFNPFDDAQTHQERSQCLRGIVMQIARNALAFLFLRGKDLHRKRLQTRVDRFQFQAACDLKDTQDPRHVKRARAREDGAYELNGNANERDEGLLIQDRGRQEGRAWDNQSSNERV